MACMVTLATSTESSGLKGGNRTKVHKTSVMDGAIELYRFLSKDL